MLLDELFNVSSIIQLHNTVTPNELVSDKVIKHG